MAGLSKSERDKKKLSINSVREGTQYITCKCAKFSGKPFKSGYWVNTIKGVELMKLTNLKGELITKLAFSFLEDDSLVSCEMVYII